MQKENNKKRDGFQGQKAVIIPRKILQRYCAKNPIISSLYLTDIGYYPKARFHYRERPNGSDQHILIYCKEGSGTVLIKKEKMYINAGDFFIIPAKTAHVYAANEENPWTIYWIHFKGILSGSIISLIEKRMKGLKGFLQFDSTNISLFNDIYREVQRGYGIDHLIYANMCLSHLLTSFIYNDKFEPNGKLAKKDVTDLAIDFLKRHLDEALTLEEIARSVNLSATHFCSLFKKKTGFSPIEYFSHLKVQKACQYLLFTKLRVKEISLELGIDDPYYFSRIFSKVMGISPKDYREKRGH